MKKLIQLLRIFFIFFLVIFTIGATSPEENTDNNNQYKKLEDLKKELKEERKLIDQQRFEEIRLKELEKQEKESKLNEENEENSNKLNNIKQENENIKNNDTNNIPSLIVRLRGKHTTKYLCSYNFKIKSENVEDILSNTIFDSYEQLYKKPSLKVRSGEVINFEFSQKPKKITVYVWNDQKDEIKLNKNSIKVPDLDEKIVVAIEGKYNYGEIKYAIVLDIRK